MTPFENGPPIDGRWQPATVPLPADRLPPQSLEAERGVLGSVLFDNAVFDEVLELVEARDFYRDTHQAIFRAMADLHARGVPIDAIILAEELKRRGVFDDDGALLAITEIVNDVPHALNAGYYAGIVRQKAVKRLQIEDSHETLHEAYCDELTAEEIIDQAEARIARIRARAEPHDDGPPPPRWPDRLDPRARHGLAGEILGLIEPHTEADPAAILVQLLAAFSSIIGHGPHWRVEATRHALNLFCVVVGASAKARKGTGWNRVLDLFEGCDPAWHDCITSGLSSGQGVIWRVRDPIFKEENKRAGGTLTGFEKVVVHEGVEDKRLLVVESEFAGPLVQMAQEGNILSVIIRQAWESGNLNTLTKNNKESAVKATGAHIAIVGHITCPELTQVLPLVSLHNGFANRFLWVCAKRSKKLPFGGASGSVDWADPLNRLRDAVVRARGFAGELRLDAEARELWREAYDVLGETRPGPVGMATARAEPQVMRLACLYALLDEAADWGDPVVGRVHLDAALALWRYCEQSAEFIFGAELADPDAEKVLAALREAGKEGLTQNRIRRRVLWDRLNGEALARLLAGLLRAGHVEQVLTPTGGRPARRWFLKGCEPADEAPSN